MATTVAAPPATQSASTAKMVTLRIWRGDAKGGQFVTHVKALPGNPYDGHTLETVVPDMEALIGNTITRILARDGQTVPSLPPSAA